MNTRFLPAAQHAVDAAQLPCLSETEERGRGALIERPATRRLLRRLDATARAHALPKALLVVRAQRIVDLVRKHDAVGEHRARRGGRHLLDAPRVPPTPHHRVVLPHVRIAVAQPLLHNVIIRDVSDVRVEGEAKDVLYVEIISACRGSRSGGATHAAAVQDLVHDLAALPAPRRIAVAHHHLGVPARALSVNVRVSLLRLQQHRERAVRVVLAALARGGGRSLCVVVVVVVVAHV